MSDNVEVINPQGPGSTVTPSSSATAQQAKTAADANAKADGQTKRCSGGQCGTEVPGQCCEWMSKFNIAMQRAMRPYSNSCGSCGGSGDKGGGPCQACDGTGIENSTGGGFNQPVTLVRLEYLTEEAQLEEYVQKWGLSPLTTFFLATKTQFVTHWKFNFVRYVTKVYTSVTLDTLNSCTKAHGYLVFYSDAYYKSNPIPIYYYDNKYFAIKSDLLAEFPSEDF